MIIIEGTVRIRDIDAAREAMAAVIEGSRAEEGCIHYAYAVDVLDPNLIHISERWECMASLGAHAQTPHFIAWQKASAGFGISDVSLRMYDAEPQELKLP